MGFKTALFSSLLAVSLTANAWAASKEHAIAMHGDIKYGPDFTHFEYTNPKAPKGGSLRLSALGSTFDTFNPFTLKGIPAAGVDLVFETLLVSSKDEPFTEYGLLAETIETPEDRSWVIFNLRPQAKWQDGKSITAEDVVFSFNTLMEKGHPRYRYYYSEVEKAEILSERSVKFSFKGNENRELALIIGQIPVLPKHVWEGKDFEKTTLEQPVGSGPYRLKSYESGRSVVYERDPNYWGANLAVNAGQNNFDEIRYDYYRDATVAVEAFKGGAFDYRYENIAKNWATSYDIPEIKNGQIEKLRFTHQVPTGMQAFVYNIRRDKFKDPLVRQALAYAFDFDWANKNLFHEEYSRTQSYFSNSELASSGLPKGRELEILEKYRDKLPADVFTKTYQPPKTDGSGNIRANLKQAVLLLKKAGWSVRKGKMVNESTNQPLAFEILLQANPAWERIVLPFKKNLERIGIDLSVRMVDSAQYKQRTDTFDYDMIIDVFGQSLSPGNEQYGYWSSKTANSPGSNNTIGISNDVVDTLVEMVVNAPSRAELVARTRALDRVLLWGHYVIPNWHLKSARILAWSKFDRPKIYPKYSPGYTAWTYWWFDPKKAEKLREQKGK